MSTLNTERFPTFSDFNQYFFSCFDDAKVFDCQDFNLIKVAQEGVKLEYSHPSHFGKPWSLYRTILLGKGGRDRLTKGAIPAEFRKPFPSVPYLLLDVGRTVSDEQGENISPYFGKILSYFDDGSYVFGQSHNMESPLIYDFLFRELLAYHNQIPVTEDAATLYRDLIDTLSQIKLTSNFWDEDIESIGRAFERFWIRYRVWNYILKRGTFSQCLFICHYHQEGLLLALKKNHVEAIELQHGLIAEESIFYVYPEIIQEVASRALFADQIWVYGQLWKDRLLNGYEYVENQIKLLGYYPYENQHSDTQLQARWRRLAGEGVPTILVTTQTHLHEFFIEYLTWLLEDMDKREMAGHIFLKPHPAEDPGLYQGLLEHPRVESAEGNLKDLFEFADIQLSIFSNTLYEGCRYNLSNFSINAESRKDHIAAMEKAGVTKKVNIGENPLDFDMEDSTAKIAQYIYADLNLDLLPLTLKV